MPNKQARIDAATKQFNKQLNTTQEQTHQTQRAQITQTGTTITKHRKQRYIQHARNIRKNTN